MADSFQVNLQQRGQRRKRECHRLAESPQGATAEWKVHLLKAHCRHLWKAFRAPRPITRGGEKSIVSHFLVRGIDFPDKVHHILGVCLNHFLAKWNGSHAPQIVSSSIAISGVAMPGVTNQFHQRGRQSSPNTEDEQKMPPSQSSYGCQIFRCLFYLLKKKI